ncbi:nucleotidyl transferase AbiEii/AbiGii toxin family protein [uncultured Thiodictyon sp.]|uniref:nucleotidyl transferase AbiEii/AbiGii toxin family protein n=1 Tax=uncultured Thiodictyon sp. TaxID=1846217 RepID=UPI0025CDE424|nr:nucleotidyl transferase AbiEii/AbiGii toxin family protein [uncultured Thiodictyon sp.]
MEKIAEKLRALLQQEVRNRVRRQDIYDLHYLLSEHPLPNEPPTRARILERLIAKAWARDLEVSSGAMANPEIIRRSRAEYKNRAHRRLPPLRLTCPRTPLCTRRTSCPAISNSP